jgi:hypothetical protein
MTVKNTPFLVSAGLVILATLISQIPDFETNFLIPFHTNHPHVFTILEGVVGLILLWVTGQGAKKAVVNP